MSTWNIRACSFSRLFLGIFLFALLGLSGSSLRAEPDDNAAIAKSLADMLRAARQVISSNQARINDPNLGDKGLTGQVALHQPAPGSERAEETTPDSPSPLTRL